MMSNSFRSFQPPTLEQLGHKLLAVHTELRQLTEAVGVRFVQLEQQIQDNNALTDHALDEMSLQIAFLMSRITITRPLHAGLAGPDGKIPVETKTASQVYMESGRAQILAKREEFKRAQGLSAESAAPAANGKAPDDADAIADAAPRSPLITH